MISGAKYIPRCEIVTQKYHRLQLFNIVKKKEKNMEVTVGNKTLKRQLFYCQIFAICRLKNVLLYYIFEFGHIRDFLVIMFKKIIVILVDNSLCGE